MGRHIAAVVLLACLAVVAVDSKYMVIYPSTALAGGKFTSVVTLKDHDPPSTQVTVKLNRQGDKTITAQGTLAIANGESRELTIEIPGSVVAGTYEVSAQVGSSSLTAVTDSSVPRTVTISASSVSVFVQTDKAKYKPGQTVKFRVVPVDVNLRPVTGDVDISIHDAKNNKIKQWLKVKNSAGVVSRELGLSDEPVLGDWMIRVVINGVKTEKKFTVEKYVLPKFEVKVNLPNYILDDENLVVTTSAKYTFGKNVAGQLKLSISRGSSSALTITDTIDGEATTVVPMRQIKGHIGANLANSALTVKAEVTEAVTGNVLSGESSVDVKPFDVELKFTKASDDYFKQGLKYRAVVLATQPDGQPLSALAERRPHAVKLKVTINGKTDLETDEQLVPPNGEISFDISVPDNTHSLRLQAVYVQSPSVTTSKYVQQFTSEMKQSIQILPKLGQGKLKVGQNGEFIIRATSLVKNFVVSVKSRGKIVYSKQHELPATTAGQSQAMAFTIPVSVNMAPSSNAIVYALVKNASGSFEMIADSYPFELDQVFENQVSIAFNKNRAELSEDVQVDLEAAPGSYIGVLCVDQSVKLLQTGNDITTDDVLKALEKYDGAEDSSGGGCGFRGCMARKKRSIAPWYWTSSSTSADVLKNAGVRFITDALYSLPHQVWYAAEGPAIAERNEAMDGAIFKATSVSGSTSNDQPAATERVRQEFPETWIWSDRLAGADGRAQITATVPDTITSWVASAFAVSDTAGLGLAPTEAKLQAFKPFFISLNLPYSVKQSEEFMLNAIVFNYLPKEETVYVTLFKSSQFKVRHGNDVPDATAAENKEVEEKIQVKSGQAKAVSFWVVTEDIGSIKIRVRAKASTAVDTLERILIVDPKGKREERNTAILVEGTTEEQEYDIDVDIPTANLVAGSERVEFQVVGDILGPALQNMDKLLRMPYGCGEQNMINFAPAIYITKYLRVTNQLTAEIEAKATAIQEKGYQRELTYVRKDNSVSAFGDRDDSGSTWLTAFVYKCFSQADNVDVDAKVLNSMKSWLLRQRENGKFNEPGRVIHADMQGGSADGIAMTAYVVIALLEGKTGEEKTTMKSNLQTSITLIERTVSDTSDPYIMAICIYALKLADSTAADTQLSRLKTMAQTDLNLRKQMIDGVCLTKKRDNAGIYRYSHSQPKSRDVEQAAYILMTLTLNNDIAGGSKLAKCLMGQRNAYGGFASTQDTVLALQALSAFATRISGKARSLEIVLDAGSQKRTMNINDKNAGVLQTVVLPESTRSVRFKVKGEGTCLVQVAYWYNVDAQTNVVPLVLTTRTKSIDKKKFQIVACTTWTNNTRKSGMGMLKIGLPSGYQPVPGSAEARGMKRSDSDATSMNIYLDEFTSSENCVSLQAEQTMPVSNLQPVAVQAYPYYEPDQQKVAFYSTSEVAVETPCQLCPSCRGCPSYISSAHKTTGQSALIMLISFMVLVWIAPIRN